MCGHVFCRTCIFSCLKRKGECPMCRMKLVKRALRPVQHLKNLATTHAKLTQAIDRLAKFSIENDDIVEDISDSNFGQQPGAQESEEDKEQGKENKYGKMKVNKENAARKACGASIACNDMQLQSMSPAVQRHNWGGEFENLTSPNSLSSCTHVEFSSCSQTSSPGPSSSLNIPRATPSPGERAQPARRASRTPLRYIGF